ncbi:hypothetical protein LguiB_027569 [Lonicera macranthoides]
MANDSRSGCKIKDELANLSRSHFSPTDSALRDCDELIGDAVNRLNNSVASMRLGLTEEMTGDLNAWISGAMTDLETCLDGLEEMGSTAVDEVRVKVRISSTRAMMSDAAFKFNQTAIDCVLPNSSGEVFECFGRPCVWLHRPLRSYCAKAAGIVDVAVESNCRSVVEWCSEVDMNPLRGELEPLFGDNRKLILLVNATLLFCHRESQARIYQYLTKYKFLAGSASGDANDAAHALAKFILRSGPFKEASSLSTKLGLLLDRDHEVVSR